MCSTAPSSGRCDWVSRFMTLGQSAWPARRMVQGRLASIAPSKKAIARYAKWRQWGLGEQAVDAMLPLIPWKGLEELRRRSRSRASAGARPWTRRWVQCEPPGAHASKPDARLSQARRRCNPDAVNVGDRLGLKGGLLAPAVRFQRRDQQLVDGSATGEGLGAQPFIGILTKAHIELHAAADAT